MEISRADLIGATRIDDDDGARARIAIEKHKTCCCYPGYPKKAERRLFFCFCFFCFFFCCFACSTRDCCS